MPDARYLDLETKKLPSDAVQKKKKEKREIKRSPENAELVRRDLQANAKKKQTRCVTGLCHIFVFHVVVIQRFHRILDVLRSLYQVRLD